MFNENNNGRPRFDSLTGLPINYNDVPGEEKVPQSADTKTEEPTNIQFTQRKTEDVETEDVETEDVETEDVETEDIETVDVETVDVRTEDVETEDVETVDVRTEDNVAATQENIDSQYRFSSREIPYGSTFNSTESNAGTEFGIKNQNKAYQKAARKAEQKAAKMKSSNGYNANNSKFKKVVNLVLASVMCGVIAGGTMFGVVYTGLYYFPTSQSTSDSIEIATLNSALKNNVTSSTVSDVSSSTVYMDVPNVVKTAMPAVVAISGTISTSSGFSYNPFSGGTTQASTSGTGIIIGKNDTELLIVTNAHVVDGVNNLKVSFIDDTLVNATVKGSKSDKDIAVVAVQISEIKESTIKSIAIAELGDSSDIKVGESVVAIGNALGEGQSVTVGWVSALNRSITVENTQYTNLIMTDAAINPGNSGGALLNANGQVIGINSAKYASEEVEGMGYAIPISSVKDIIDNLVTKQSRVKVASSLVSDLGVKGMDITSSISSKYGYPKGAQIRQVESGSAAEKAGLVKNDIIISFDGEDIDSFDTLYSLYDYYAAGEKVVVGYYHMENGEYVIKQVEVTLKHTS